MTIHSDWARLLHDECPEAFHTSGVPDDTRFDVGIIDGHLQLMCLNTEMGSWERFLWAVFVQPIRRLFDAGCPTVVLCFDAYDQVPTYKSMTQLKRVSRVTACEFRPEQSLPDDIPEEAMTYLMNRHFKLKVVQLALSRVPQLLQTTLAAIPQRRLVIDYKSVVEYAASSGITPLPLGDLAPMGESDVKYVRYVERYGNALVHAVDGDYLTIALLYYAKNGLRDDNRIFLFRQLSLLGGTHKEDMPSGKRKRADTTKPKAKPPKCWVDMQLLYLVIAQSVRQSGVSGLHPTTLEPFGEGDWVNAAVMLMLCAGTDFSRSLPLLGPRRLWEHLPAVANSLVQAAHLDTTPNVQLLGDAVIGKLYRIVFEKHVPCDTPSNLSCVLTNLKTRSRLAASTRTRLPSESQVRVTLENIAWVIKYWTTVNGSTPSPLDGSHGFVRCPVSGRPTFSDLIPSPSPL